MPRDRREGGIAQALAWANWLAGHAKGNAAGEAAALGLGDGEESCEFSLGPR